MTQIEQPLVTPNTWHTVENGKLFWSPNFIPSGEARRLFEQLNQQIPWR